MTARWLIVYLPMALAGIGVGTMCVLWSSHHTTASLTRTAHVDVAAPGHTTHAPSTGRPLDLQLAEHLTRGDKTTAKPKHKAQSLREYAAGKHAETESQSGADVSSAKPKTPLNLKLPTDGQDTLAHIDTRDRSENARLTDIDTTSTGKTFDFKPASVVTPDVETFKLFNPSNGLRGFMKQGWVNQSFAVQGGLALNEKRITPSDNSLRDDLAVGMGVIVAF